MTKISEIIEYPARKNKVSLLKFSKRQYLNEGGVKCPYCKSENLKSHAVLTTIEPLLMCQKITCLSCKKTWLDVYTLTDVLTEN